ncbi:MAG: M28 family peptidase [Verrucomicrobia bacterium]|nr:M28 family peptidase [Verrucomicrobiota bacterium]
MRMNFHDLRRKESLKARRPRASCILCFLSLFAAIPLFSSTVYASIQEDTAELTKHPHRLSGTPEYAEAAAYVERRLNDIGVDKVIVQTFPVTQTDVKRCELIHAGGSISLIPARPNGVIPPISPVEGIKGELVDLGASADANLNVRSVRGRIVVMDYNAGMQWIKAFRLGAKAVIFVNATDADAQNHHYLRANANLPRFFFEGERSALPVGQEITIHSEITWKQRTGRNIIAFIKGADPVFELKKEEVVLLSANLDSFGDVPRFAPAARSAANCAGLLKLAETLTENRPRRHVVIAFFDNQARSHAGSAAFYWALEEKTDEATLETRFESWQKEQDFLTRMGEALKQENPLSAMSGDVGGRLLDRIREKARDETFEVRGQLIEFRKKLELEGVSSKAEADELKQKILDTRALNDRWNELRRRLGKTNPEVEDELKDLLRRVIQGVAEDVAHRQKELASDRELLESSQDIYDLLGDRWITLHTSLILGDRTPKWGVIVGGDAEIRSASKDEPGLYGRVQSSFLRAYESLAESGIQPEHFEVASVDGSLTQPRLLWAANGLIHSGEIAGRYGIYNIVLGTIQETLPLEGTPADTLDRVNFALIEQKISEIGRMMTAVGSQAVVQTKTDAVADQRGLSLRRVIAQDYSYIIPRFRGGSAEGALVMGRHRGSSIPNQPLAGAVVQLTLQEPWNNIFWPHNKFAAFDPFIVTMSDGNGAYTAGPLPREDSDPKPVGFATVFDERGDVLQVSDMKSFKTVRTRLNMIRCKAGFVLMSPQLWPGDAHVMDAIGNGRLTTDTSEKGFGETTDGITYFYVDEKIEAVKLFGDSSSVILNNANKNPEEREIENPLGNGIPIGADWLSYLPSYLGAGDLWRINESRLALLRSRDIMNSSLEELHGRVEDLLQEADKEQRPLVGESLAASSFLSARPVYTMVRGIMDDLVTAVLILLALCIPFAFALERLLIGSSLIYKQVSWFTGFFILTFVVLYLSHPAFAIAQTPVIIFLGFAVVVLASLVIFIIMRKFEVELKTLQGMTSTVHASDISRFNTVMAAMAMGISTMRRRPLRTALTAVTIVLLTFTILCFASFDTQRGIIKFFSAPSPTYTGVLLHQPSWGTYNPDFVELIHGRWDAEADVTTRHWVCPEFPQDPDFVVCHEDGSTPVVLKGILGIDPVELAHRRDLQDLLQIDDPSLIETHVFVTDAAAELLGVRPGDKVIAKGIPLIVGPLVNATKLTAIRDMDSTSIIPVDYAQMQNTAAKATQATAEDLLTEQSTWASLPSDAVMIISDRNAARAGGKVSVMHMYTEDAQQSSQLAEELARMLEKIPIVATRTDGVYRHIQGTVVAASGVADLLFPVLLGGLVIFGTMLGSVADREKEIYTFSALGLAPPHVASLFFAEAMVYSVIGGMGGYLIAQGTMKVLGLLASYGLVQVPEMNYSSTNAIVTILIVMATVLVSAIYPAIKASKSANPGLLRSWKPPAPEGDVYELVFPFTVSEYDLTGVVSFLKEHFDNFSDTGLGDFMARDALLIRHEDGWLGLQAQVALAPFDLGVTQHFQLRSAPSEIPGIDEVNIRLVRKSGQPRDWVRLNKNLFDDLRQQFLLWRSLPKETMEHYRSQTLVKLKEMPS